MVYPLDRQLITIRMLEVFHSNSTYKYSYYFLYLNISLSSTKD